MRWLVVFDKKMNRSLVFDLATGAFIAKHEDALFLGPPDLSLPSRKPHNDSVRAG